MFINRVGSAYLLAAGASLGTIAGSPLSDPIPPLIPQGPVHVRLTPVVTGLPSPVDLVAAPDSSGRLFIIDQTGKIFVLSNGALLATPFLDESAHIVPLNATYDERGLLDLAFHPGFTNPNSPGFHKLYTFESVPTGPAADFTFPNAGSPPASPNCQTVFYEWSVSATNPNVVDTSTKREVVRIDKPYSNHNGGALRFGPDGYLYAALGDGGRANDVGIGHNPTIGNAQDLTTILGKIIRIDPLAPSANPTSTDPVSANGKYRIPAANPFFAPGQVREIYAYGLRNPYRFTFDSVTGHLLAADVGQNYIEEVDEVVAGGNYGWNYKEGSFLFNKSNATVSIGPDPIPGLIDPVIEYDHPQAGQPYLICIIGGPVYRGTAMPDFQGKYFFADLSGPLFAGDLATASTTGNIHQIGRIGNLYRYVKGFGVDANNELYVLASQNEGPGGAQGAVFSVSEITCLSDLNGDNAVDDADFSIFVTAYDKQACTDPSMAPGCASDLNFDGVVDDLDFAIFVVAYDALLCP
jgi:glucose/arabinose dehydrogenase